MICRYFKTIIYCFISSCLIIFFQKTFIQLVPNFKGQISFLPFIFLGSMFLVFFDLVLSWMIFAVFKHKKIELIEFINRFSNSYAFFLMVSEIITVILNLFIDNKSILNVCGIIPSIFLCLNLNKFCAEINISGRKKFFMLLIIFALLSII